MLAGTGLPGLTERDMHLQLAVSSAWVQDPAAAIHHVEHYLALVDADFPEAALGAEVLVLLEAGELAEAEHETSEQLGTPIEEDHHPEEDEHHDEDDHEHN